MGGLQPGYSCKTSTRRIMCATAWKTTTILILSLLYIEGSGQRGDLLGDHVVFETVLNTSATGAIIPAMEYSIDDIQQKEILEEEPNETNGLQPSREKSVQSPVKPDESAGPPVDENMFFEDTDNDGDEILPVEQRLMNHLLRNYERSVRPVKNASDTVFVRMGLTLTQIFDMAYCNVFGAIANKFGRTNLLIDSKGIH